MLCDFWRGEERAGGGKEAGRTGVLIGVSGGDLEGGRGLLCVWWCSLLIIIKGISGRKKERKEWRRNLPVNEEKRKDPREDNENPGGVETDCVWYGGPLCAEGRKRGRKKPVVTIKHCVLKEGREQAGGDRTCSGVSGREEDKEPVVLGRTACVCVCV